MVAGATFVASESVGPATQVITECNTPVTGSGTDVLGADIGDGTTGACLEIAPDDVVLDGSGHTVDGVSRPDLGTDRRAVVAAGGPAGPLTDVAVRNLTARNWSTGVDLGDVSDGRVEAVTATAVTVSGVDADRSTDVRVVGNDLSGGLYGGTVTGSTGTLVADNRIGDVDGDGDRDLLVHFATAIPDSTATTRWGNSWAN